MIPLSIEDYRSKERPEFDLLFFYTPLCGTCKLGERMLEIVEETLRNPQLTVYSCRVAEWETLVQEWKVESVPALLLFKNGHLEKKIYAFESVPFLFETIQTFVNT